MEKTTLYCIISVTSNRYEHAKTIAKMIVEQKLAACVQLIPKIESIYSWDQKIQEDQEVLLHIKTKPEHFEKIETLVKHNHHYETPEIIMTEIIKGSREYLSWVDQSC